MDFIDLVDLIVLVTLVGAIIAAAHTVLDHLLDRIGEIALL